MSELSPPSSAPQRLLLLRHGEVDSHRGDVPVTASGLAFATEVGRHLAAHGDGTLRILTGDTLRTRQTAKAITDGARDAGARVDGPHVAFALRNPDLYVAGERVDMVSSLAALAAQVDGLDEHRAGGVPFFEGFLSADDRIGWWLRNPSPPGDDAAAVARRIRNFAASLADRPDVHLIVGVTHSPVLRACAIDLLGKDPGEPEWVAGLEFEIHPDRSVRLRMLSQAP